jgi:hypothetical protein
MVALAPTGRGRARSRSRRGRGRGVHRHEGEHSPGGPWNLRRRDRHEHGGRQQWCGRRRHSDDHDHDHDHDHDECILLVVELEVDDVERGRDHAQGHLDEPRERHDECEQHRSNLCDLLGSARLELPDAAPVAERPRQLEP